jgi:hypothetical protein
MLGRSWGRGFEYEEGSEDAKVAARRRRIEKVRADVESIGVPGVIAVGHQMIRASADVTPAQADEACRRLTDMGYNPGDYRELLNYGDIDI